MRENTYEAMVNNSQILLKEFPKFDENINKYFDKKNGWASQFTIVNTFNKKFSLAVTIYELDGIYVDFGPVTVIEQEISVDEEVLRCISDILNDKYIIISAYKNSKAYDKNKCYFDAVFPEFDEDEDVSFAEYKRFIEKIKTPAVGIKRYFTFYTGIFEITNWSGSEYKKIIR